MNFGALKWFGSFIKKLIKNIGQYQPRDLHLWYRLNRTIIFNVTSAILVRTRSEICYIVYVQWACKLFRLTIYWDRCQLLETSWQTITNSLAPTWSYRMTKIVFEFSSFFYFWIVSLNYIEDGNHSTKKKQSSKIKKMKWQLKMKVECN